LCEIEREKFLRDSYPLFIKKFGADLAKNRCFSQCPDSAALKHFVLAQKMGFPFTDNRKLNLKIPYKEKAHNYLKIDSEFRKVFS
jgi:hypothetical protein